VGESYAPDEYFYIGFWILVSRNTKGNWEFLLYFCANFADKISAKGKFGTIVTVQSE